MAKRKIRRYARRAYAAGRSFAAGIKYDAAAAGGGLAAGLVQEHFLTSKPDEEPGFFEEHWWARGGLLAIVGLVFRRYVNLGGMGAPVGYGILGAAGAELYRSYQADSEQQPSSGDSAGVWGRRPWRSVDAGAIVDSTFGPALGEASGGWGTPAAQEWAGVAR